MRKVLLALLFGVITANLYAQRATDVYRAVYQYEYIKDSINSRVVNDIVHLELYHNKSFCYSKYTWELDSLMATPNGERLFEELLTASLRRDGPLAGTYPHKRSTFMISKDRDNRKIIVNDCLNDEYYEYIDSMEEFVWSISDTTRIINGKSAIKAETTYHGRNWEVWFCPELPWSDGPWKFCGLPGLIVEAMDKDKLFVFRLTNLFPCNTPIKNWSSDVVYIERKAFLKKRYKSLKNSGVRYNLEIGTGVSSKKDTRYIIGIEPDFEH